MPDKILKPLVLIVLAFFVWMLAVTWQPFGTPTLLWHIINGLVVVIGIIWILIEVKLDEN